MKKSIWITLVAVVIIMVGCSAFKNASQMLNCKYSYNSISGIKVAGIDFSNITAASLITAIPQITKIIQGNFSDLPFELTVNVNVMNPSTTKTAALSDMRYQMAIDNIDVASGNLGRKFSVEPGKTNVLPVVVKTNLGNLLNAQNRSQVVQIVKNFTGISGEESTIKMKVKPVLVTKSGTNLTMPEVPLSFKYSGKKK
ncbi:MAG: hypothetical protein KBT40_05450 [bacterium]|nr:hypothetical protein [Candidatus Minthenecus merdequi]